MSELKFRAWDKNTAKYADGVGELLYADILEVGTRVFSIVQMCPGRYTIEQFTGLKDKNGKEIYEGDIVKYAWTRCNYIVAYRKYDASFVLENDDREEIMLFQYNRQNDYEVIGNIHENPELLEAEK